MDLESSLGDVAACLGDRNTRDVGDFDEAGGNNNGYRASRSQLRTLGGVLGEYVAGGLIGVFFGDVPKLEARVTERRTNSIEGRQPEKLGNGRLLPTGADRDIDCLTLFDALSGCWLLGNNGAGCAVGDFRGLRTEAQFELRETRGGFLEVQSVQVGNRDEVGGGAAEDKPADAQGSEDRHSDSREADYPENRTPPGTSAAAPRGVIDRIRGWWLPSHRLHRCHLTGGVGDDGRDGGGDRCTGNSPLNVGPELRRALVAIIRALSERAKHDRVDLRGHSVIHLGRWRGHLADVLVGDRDGALSGEGWLPDE